MRNDAARQSVSTGMSDGLVQAGIRWPSRVKLQPVQVRALDTIAAARGIQWRSFVQVEVCETGGELSPERLQMMLTFQELKALLSGQE